MATRFPQMRNVPLGGAQTLLVDEIPGSQE
jgi:hypothetical protein